MLHLARRLCCHPGARGASARLASSVSIDRDSKRVTIEPEHGATACVIFSHGLGDSALGWADAAQYWAQALHHVRFVLPTAPVQPVTLNGGMRMPSWYDIAGLSDRFNEQCDGIEASRETIAGLVAEAEADGLPRDRIVVAGFSQGGALALYTGLQMDPAPAGIACMSGYVPAPAELAGKVAAPEAVPVALFHGEEDPMVRLEWAQTSHEWLRDTAGVTDLSLKTYAELEHSASMEEVVDVQAFLERVLPRV